MAAGKKDPTEPIRLRASRYAGVDEGTACTQSSFKAGKKGFLYIGMQGGRYKAMFKLQQSMAEATRLAGKHPDDYQVGAGGWVTARFTAEKPMPATRWRKWLDESYELSVGGAGKKPSAARKTVGKKAATRTAAKTRTARKATTATRKSAPKKATASRKTAAKKTIRKSASRSR